MNSINSSNGFFPDEIILQILARLPIKPLFRFKIVCKYWNKLPSDSYFIKLYNNLSVFNNSMVIVEVNDVVEQKSRLICVDFNAGVSEISLDYMKIRVKIRASCNGLLICSSVPEKGMFYVCNPMTRDYKPLPKSRERNVSRFYPDGDATLVGIACDLIDCRKFSVVLAGFHRAFGQRPEKMLVCLVYNSEVNKWRKFVSFEAEGLGFSQMNRNQVVFVNGGMHWLTESYTCLLVLDLGGDVWRRIYLPGEMGCGTGVRMYLFELEGCLAVIQISDAWMSTWVLEEYEKRVWRMVDRVSLRCIRGLVPRIFPVSLNRECVFLATHKQVLLYHRRSKVWKEMFSVKSNATLPLWFSAHAFQNTIFSCR